VREMKGIPPKCLDCGKILVYDGGKAMYFCPECEPKKSKEMKKAA
jgi:predicted RNA-binding Zn-ribbon protein involved in translation (DUF1610 family)